ncbi:MAG: haloacid dehalogenase type II [Streptosporangiales bacterium]|nr:haloacid dehalogenase type II [Streptosporangiales bacterium]
MREALAFDMYGTLVDPISVRRRLEETVGDAAAAVAEQWRSKQLEYTFRLTAMGRYLDFAEVTARGLDYALLATGQTIDETQRQELLAEYQRLAPYPDTVGGLRRLAAAGHPMVVFSNGTPAMLDALLDTTGLRELVPEAVSVDEVRAYKPAPAVYRHLTERLGHPPEQVMLVSSNPFDIVGATAAGLRAAWCNRSGGVFDTLGDPPDIVVDTLEELADALTRARETDRG